jgi:hypothetical protein
MKFSGGPRYERGRGPEEIWVHDEVPIGGKICDKGQEQGGEKERIASGTASKLGFGRS